MHQKSFVYILANRPRGALYVGVTTHLSLRVYQHKKKLMGFYTRRYNINQLVYYEVLTNLTEAIAREKQLKHWKRAWKIELIESFNPEWKDLYTK